MTDLVLSTKIAITSVKGSTSVEGLKDIATDDVLQISFGLAVAERHGHGLKALNLVVQNMRSGSVSVVKQTILAKTLSRCFTYEVLS